MTISYAHMLRFSTSFFNGKLSFTSDNKGRRTQLLPFASLKRPDNNIIIDPKRFHLLFQSNACVANLYSTSCLLVASSLPISSTVFSFSPFHSKVDSLQDGVKWDDKGLAVAIARNVDTGAILMQGFANREAVFSTLSSRKATFFSRSLSTLWTKGETSNNYINIHDVFLDCDRESIIYLGKPDGPTCHTGAETCYYTSVFDSLKQQEIERNRLALSSLYSLESTISQRKVELAEENGKPSWTKRLLINDKLLCSKIR